MARSQMLISAVAIIFLLVVQSVSAVSARHQSASDDHSSFKELPTVFYVFKDALKEDGYFWSNSSTPPSSSPVPPYLVATVEHHQQMKTTGWDILNVWTHAQVTEGSNETIPSVIQAYGAGFGEGLTARISARQYFTNIFGAENYTAQPPLTAFLDANDAWMETQIAKYVTELGRMTHPDKYRYWYVVQASLAQMHGLLAGLNYDLPPGFPEFTYDQLRLLQTQGDQMDLSLALNLTSPSGSQEMEVEAEGEEDVASRAKREEVPSVLFRSKIFAEQQMKKKKGSAAAATDLHCSSLIGLDESNNDLFFGHATWGTYNMMLRVFKSYHFSFYNPAQLGGSAAGSTTVTFSSYPAVMVSIDDYYTTSLGLVTAETSFTTYNLTLYQAVTNQSVLYWFRTIIANRLGSTGAEWTTLFGLHNSGTYNAQWIVADLKKFVKGADVADGLLWIGEQFPGYYAALDVSRYLAVAGFWGSFNIPFNRTLYEVSGNAADAAGPGGFAMGSWEQNVRAQIWRRDASMVAKSPNKLKAFMREMQYNNYTHDPLSQGIPTFAIASRGDLAQGSPMCWGAIDAKVTSYGLYAEVVKSEMKKVREPESEVASLSTMRQVAAPSYVYNGPTPMVGVFEFSTSPPNAPLCSSIPPLGMVNTYNFSWVFVGK